MSPSVPEEPAIWNSDKRLLPPFPHTSGWMYRLCFHASSSWKLCEYSLSSLWEESMCPWNSCLFDPITLTTTVYPLFSFIEALNGWPSLSWIGHGLHLRYCWAWSNFNSVTNVPSITSATAMPHLYSPHSTPLLLLMSSPQLSYYNHPGCRTSNIIN